MNDNLEIQELLNSIEGVVEQDSVLEQPEESFYDVDDALKHNEYFKPLGYKDKHYYLFNFGNGDVEGFTAHTIMSKNLCSAAPMDWWEEHFPKVNKNGDVVGVDYDMAGDSLMGICRELDKPDMDNIRGLGFWMDDERIVSNEGNFLIVDEEQMDRHDLDTSYFYKKDIAPEPCLAPAIDPKDLQEVLEVFKALSWSKDASAELVFGWCMLAPMCGVLRWRPHMWITAIQGKGKSWVLEFIEQVIGGKNRALVFQGGISTESGVRQHMGSCSLPMIMDEAEATTMKAKVNITGIIAYLRSASSANDSKMVHGNSEGTGVSYATSAMACMGSISDAMLKEDSDKARFARLVIVDSMEPDAYSHANTVVKPKWMKHDSELRKSIVSYHANNIRFTLKNIEVFSEAFELHFKCDRRQSDQYATLTAGAWSALNPGKTVSVDEAVKYLIDIKLSIDSLDSRVFNDAGHQVYSALISMPVKYQTNTGAPKTDTVMRLVQQCENSENCEIEGRSHLTMMRHALNLIGIEISSVRSGRPQFVVTENAEITKYFMDKYPNVGESWWGNLGKSENWVKTTRNKKSILGRDYRGPEQLLLGFKMPDTIEDEFVVEDDFQ